LLRLAFLLDAAQALRQQTGMFDGTTHV
jgi:hypothetical protein